MPGNPMSGDAGRVSGQHKAFSVVYLPVDALKPASRNARTHSPEQIIQLQRSITEFGWTNPILIDDASGIVAGHGRLHAAIALGMADVPTITLTGLSAAQKRALIIADNKPSRHGRCRLTSRRTASAHRASGKGGRKSRWTWP